MHINFKKIGRSINRHIIKPLEHDIKYVEQHVIKPVYNDVAKPLILAPTKGWDAVENISKGPGSLVLIIGVVVAGAFFLKR